MSAWHEFRHEAMATTFAIAVARQPADYARQAAAAAFRELARLEGELSRYIESSDIAAANRLARGQTIAIGDDTLQCLLLAGAVAEATGRAFDPAYASQRAPDRAPTAPCFTLDPAAHTLTSQAARLHLDLGAVGKGYALDRMADTLREWSIDAACLQSGGSTALAFGRADETAGWPVGLGEGATRRIVPLRDAALSGSGLAVKGEHLIDPRTGASATRRERAWALATEAAVADALSTAFFVMSDAEVAAFCAARPDIGAALAATDGRLATHGALARL